MLKIILLTFFITIFVSCSEKVNVSPTPKVVIPPIDTSTKTDISTLPNLNSYHRFQVIGHGATGSTVQWSSSTAIDLQGDQGLFVTDTRLNMRIKVLASPGKVAQDSSGTECMKYPMNYSKLKLTLGVRSEDSSIYIEKNTFDNISIGSTSSHHYFPVPPNSATKPFIVDLMDVQWDWGCLQGDQLYCPFARVWPLDCFEIQIQMATDYTEDLI